MLMASIQFSRVTVCAATGANWCWAIITGWKNRLIIICRFLKPLADRCSANGSWKPASDGTGKYPVYKIDRIGQVVLQ